ncbi:hypothetical protein AVEN_18435-1 [Araneus ventricosus]|uniref:Uncharacterized protein n=1 Tax=Araneus ventricosus TaxID=182803 RepID=A0A4Y2G6R0_ARAVE|nr:hypothetical protein AVEN_18435-1 [Araneus ventricosus]
MFPSFPPVPSADEKAAFCELEHLSPENAAFENNIFRESWCSSWKLLHCVRRSENKTFHLLDTYAAARSLVLRFHSDAWNVHKNAFSGRV